MDIKNTVYCFSLFNITTIRSEDTLKTTSEGLAAFDNVVPAHDHSFPVNGYYESGNVQSLLIAIHSRSTAVLRVVMFSPCSRPFIPGQRLL